MIKEFIMYIGYKTAETFPDRTKGSFNQFGRARVFITIVIGLNIVEFALIINSILFQKKIPLTMEHLYLGSPLFGFIVYLFIIQIFKKNVLAKSIKRYKETNFAEYGRVIGLLYFLLNFAITVILASNMGRFNE